MNKHVIDMELLAPAGGFEQLRAAIDFGADAVYLGGDTFSMRARAANFSMDELPKAVAMAYESNVDVHLTCNVLMMQDDIGAIPSFLEKAQDAGVDALIIGDIGVASLARKHAPNCDIHVSTQASVANSEAAKVWYSLGATRVVCAREMTLEDIARMRANIPDDMQIEVFAHGAQCMAMSGRCLISSYLTGRSGNKGNCTQPCRWSYQLEEEKRPGMYFPIVEDENATFIMNAKDLCMVSHLRELKDAGVDSIKIEGRNKKAFYVATVVGAYKRALDGEDPVLLEEELLSASHRPFSTGFFFGNPQQADDFDGYEQETMHVADVVSCDPISDGKFELKLLCRNRFAEGESLEALVPDSPVIPITIENLKWMSCSDENSEDFRLIDVDVANRSKEIYLCKVETEIPTGSFMRIRNYRRSARH